MIVVRLIGGLGNQMFQYAAGHALSLRNGDELQLDTSDFVGYDLHNGFELDSVFGICRKQATHETLSYLMGWRRHKLVSQLLERFPSLKFGSPHLLKEPHFHYWIGWEHLHGPLYLSGYWQCERYFDNYEQSIRHEFRFIQPFDEKSREVADQIQAVTSVSLHVRRGDYSTDPITNAVHGLCTPTYYKRAVDHFSNRLGSMHLFIFSDDIDWAKANLSLEAIPHTFVNHNKGKNSWRDMQLMSLCRHHIIANSSFSWWAAWLNPSEEKIVVAPKRWFAKPLNTSDLIPRSWICL